MDAATPVSLFDDVAALKLTNPNLKIYVSIGGWTFSDNNTETQAVFGDIAKSSKNRATFAKNVMAFLDEYGFDGVDLDWYVNPEFIRASVAHYITGNILGPATEEARKKIPTTTSSL